MADRARQAAGLAVVAVALYAARRYYLNWGTTKQECRMRLPGDELVRDPAVQATEAVWIAAPRSDVWPWLVQLGQDRGGFYSSETFGALIGLGFHNADRIRPELQQLALHDTIRVAPAGWLGLPDGLAFTVAELVPGGHIVLRSQHTGLPWEAVWSFHLLPHWQDPSRLVVRVRSGLRHPGEVIGVEVVRPLATLGVRAMLRGIQRRAERR